MKLKISPKIKEEMIKILEKYGYKNEREFLEDALWHRILELKREEFFSKVEEIKTKLKEKRISEEEILKDFDKFYHQK